jgi:hypothetical protein
MWALDCRGHALKQARLPDWCGCLHKQPTEMTHPSGVAAQEELDRQSPVVEDIDRQLNRVTSKLKSSNAKLKGIVLQVSAPPCGQGPV